MQICRPPFPLTDRCWHIFPKMKAQRINTVSLKMFGIALSRQITYKCCSNLDFTAVNVLPEGRPISQKTKVFFVTLRTKEGHFDPLLTQKPKKLEQ